MRHHYQIMTDSGKLHIAVAGSGQNWNGTALYRSSDGGEFGSNNFELVKVFEKASTFGVAMTVLENGIETWDRGNSLRCFNSGTLSSVTELAVLMGLMLLCWGMN